MNNNSEFRSHALYLFKKNLPLILFQIAILTAVNTFLDISIVLNPDTIPWVSVAVTLLISVLTYLVFTFGFCYICLCMWREESFKFSDYFRFLKSPRVIFSGVSTALLYTIAVLCATIVPLFLAFIPLGFFIQNAIILGALALGISCTCAFAMVPFLFAQGQTSDVFRLFSTSSSAMGGEKWQYFKFIVGTQLIPIIITSIFITVLKSICGADAQAPLFFIPIILNALLITAISAYATIATAGYLNNRLNELKE